MLALVALLLSALFVVFSICASPVPFFGRTNIWGKKSVFDMTDDEFALSRLERERSHLRLLGTMATLAVIAALLLWLAER